MSKELRWYLFVRPPGGELRITVHRASAEVFTEWSKHQTGDLFPDGFLFAGERRPGASDVEALFALAPGRLLLSQSSRWLLPSRYEVVEDPIGEISAEVGDRPMSVYVARSGWGYEVPGCAEGSHAPLSRRDGDRRAGEIVDPGREQSRFLQALEAHNGQDPFHLARIAPTWAHGAELRTLNLTTRCSNVLRDQKIHKVADLAPFSVAEALQWANFGKKSVNDLYASLLMFLKGGSPAIVQLSNVVPNETRPSLTSAPIPEAVVSTLLQDIEQTLAGLGPKDRAVVEGRLAISGPKRTLEEIAAGLHLTRERVRQIEARFIKLMSARAPWVQRLLDSVSRLRRGREVPLYADLLEAEDEWFEGCSDRLPCVVEIIERFGEPAGHKISWVKGRPVITSIDTGSWEALKDTVLEYLRSRVGMGMTREEVGLAVDGFLTTHGCPELRSEFFAEIAEYLQFGRAHVDADDHLIGIGRSLARQLRAILERSETPLHYTEIHRVYVAGSSTETSVRSIHAAVSRSGALYYGRGMYGTWRHFPLPNIVRDQVLEAVEEVVSAGPAHKQWHVAEILGLLTEQRPDLPDGLDKYLVNIILAASTTVKPVGRFVWTGSKSAASSSLDRIEILDTCVNVLATSGSPLTTSEIKHELSRIRGVGEYFLLQTDQRIARVAPDTWGLVDRDFYLSADQVHRLLDHVVGHLQSSGLGIHISEIKPIVERCMEVPERVTPYMLLSLCQVEPRLNVYKGQFVGLRAWGESRRLTIPDVLDRDLVSSQRPLLMSEIVQHVSAAVGRTLTGQDIVNSLRIKGFIFDPDQKTWHPPALETAEDEGEIGDEDAPIGSIEPPSIPPLNPA